MGQESGGKCTLIGKIRAPFRIAAVALAANHAKSPVFQERGILLVFLATGILNQKYRCQTGLHR
jgi:hypothetical protein